MYAITDCSKILVNDQFDPKQQGEINYIFGDFKKANSHQKKI